MSKIIFATGNAGKMKEVRDILADTGKEILSMKDVGICSDPEENGADYIENAFIKARAVAKLAVEKGIRDAVILADDSGLEIDFLDKAPGIYSARYMGENTSYHIKNNHLIQQLQGVPAEKRTARFVCAIAAVFLDGTEISTTGVIEGSIGYEERGTNGFGYDPIFIVPEYGRTTAELTEEEKNKISHRGKALSRMKEELEKNENFNCQRYASEK